MDSADFGAGMDSVPNREPRRSRRAADIYHGAFRRQLCAVAVGLLLVNLALGVFARQQQHAVIDHAIDIFDSAFISTNYLHLAQVSFQQYADGRIHAEGPSEIAEANRHLDNVINQVDVAIERSTSQRSRELGQEIRENIAALSSTQSDPQVLKDRILNIQGALEELSGRSTGAGLTARDNIESFTFNSDLLLLGSIITSIMLAGLALVLLNRLFSLFKQRSGAQLSAALEGMPQGLSMFDSEQRLIVCNETYATMYGLGVEYTEPGTSLHTILEQRIRTGMSPVNFDNHLEMGLTSGSATSGVVEQELQDGRVISVISAPLSTGGGVTIHMDVTEKRSSEKRLAFLAHHDELTGLANRAQLRAHIKTNLQGAAKGQRLAVICLDLDQFKIVNDTLGHPVGDALLCAVAKRLRELVSEGDLVTRTGGDEFSIVLSNVAPASAANLAARIVEALSAPFDLGDHQVVIGASVGIAIAPDDGDNADQLLKNADMALYRAKDDGRGRFHFFEIEMDAKAQARRILELDLRKAITNGEFELFYQPIVNLNENKISGFEALLRWNHPIRGRVPPTEFVPLAEETGLIVPIGEWVIRQACSEASRWPTDLHIAVNVSPLQFRGQHLMSVVTTALAYSGLSASRLELEITETVLMHNGDTTLALLHQLRNLGVRISMDDFGTGYSSLSYLRSFPFDKIKIDQTFVRDLIDRPDAIAIIRAVAGLGRSFGMTTTAEGVETEEQLEQMRAEGCTEVQGFFYSRPLPASGVVPLLLTFQGEVGAAA